MTIEKDKLNPQLEYLCNINYDISIPQLARQGNYDWINDSYFKDPFFHSVAIKGIGNVNLELVNLGGHVTAGEAVKRLTDMHKRPAIVQELLTLGINHPSLQTQYRIIAVGSTTMQLNDPNKIQYVPFLFGWSKPFRSAEFYWWSGDWQGNGDALENRFLAVST